MREYENFLISDLANIVSSFTGPSERDCNYYKSRVIGQLAAFHKVWNSITYMGKEKYLYDLFSKDEIPNICDFYFYHFFFLELKHNREHNWCKFYNRFRNENYFKWTTGDPSILDLFPDLEKYNGKLPLRFCIDKNMNWAD